MSTPMRELQNVSGVAYDADDLDTFFAEDANAYKANIEELQDAVESLELGAGMSDLVDDTTPQLGGDLDTNNKNIIRKSIPSADNRGEGDVVADIVAGESLVFGNVVYLKSDGKWWEADADAIATAGLLAFCLETKSADQAVSVLLRGFVRDDDFNFTPGNPIYLDTATGALSVSMPTGEDDVVVLLGWATHADRFYFCPDNARLEYKA